VIIKAIFWFRDILGNFGRFTLLTKRPFSNEVSQCQDAVHDSYLIDIVQEECQPRRTDNEVFSELTLPSKLLKSALCRPNK